ncbi:TRAP transporter substrate-binding protein DctP [Pseudovibrio brasiliensis]|uniref:TRAP transporter substrate-binding protein DctP n=1 Tax=Pseudovibrio brasiliensis TaxID=1898042 RepID=A0ABX8APF1_9HYPH|nr:TRAP transporter substrate-binding protein DctP [Pseudovibrio brasiliensis]QUS56532.1 TRAP transporter substrate-binding protein DctP [Pseudovibrio brasiliensis]
MKFSSMVGKIAATSMAVAVVASPVLVSEANAVEPILGHVMDKEHIFHKVSEKFMTRLDELSDGQMKISYHPGGDLGDWTSIVEQVSFGSAQMTMSWNHSELDPRWDVSALGYVVSDWEKGKAIYGPGSKMEAVYNEILSDLNMVLLGTIPTDYTGFVVRKGVDVPVNFPEDAKGFKMRVPAMPMLLERYKTTGFSPVPMAFSEVHTALQTGAIDGRAYSPPSEVLLFKDVVSTYVNTRENFEHTFWLANKDWFNSLSADERNWIRTASKEATDWAWSVAESESAVWLQKIRDAGIEIVELNPEQLAKYKQIVVDVEYPYMENVIGKEVMDDIREAAGIQ